MTTQEQIRLDLHRQRRANWKHWGPYLSARAWGTVREDYSANENPWDFFPHDHARSRVYRWNEDGLGGISDRNQYLCFAPAFWNGKDPILKERFFGLSNEEGNHGEDVKECYFYLDSLPTHSYMKMLYKYPQSPFPYQDLVEKNRQRTSEQPEYELIDTGIFHENRYFDIFIEYAKGGENDILIKIDAHNRANEPAPLSILSTLWFRNTWSWGKAQGPMKDVETMPLLKMVNQGAIAAIHPTLGNYTLYAQDSAQPLFTENETNTQRLFGKPNAAPYVKDAFHEYLIQQNAAAINPQQQGTKAAFLHNCIIPAHEHCSIRLRLVEGNMENPFDAFDEIFNLRQKECDEFYQAIQNQHVTEEEKHVQRQAFAGLLWSKQLYYYDVEQWLKGEPQTATQRQHASSRNQGWEHLVNFDILSMPDKWEFPWFASWDLAFHCVSLVLVDPDFAKRQLTLLTREWYLHPNGQLPAYEWNFDDANPPVLAWAAWRVYKIDAHLTGVCDTAFLSGIFHKLLLNFTWWVNRKDASGRNVFQGGFLGLDNISIFDRSTSLPADGHILQSDATSWMAFYCILMIKIAMELARDRPTYEDMATKFFEHFLRIAVAMVSCGGRNHSLWDSTDAFFYDVIALPGNKFSHLKVRSLVGLLPLLAVETATAEFMDAHPLFKSRVHWFLNRHPEIPSWIAPIESDSSKDKRLLSILTRERLVSILHYLLDENEFLSPHGIRSLSKYHLKQPYQLTIDEKTYKIEYEPGETKGKAFGGNSNWRGPIWFPLNFLIIESLQKFHYYYGDDLKVECPTHSGNMMTLWEVATEISQRLISLFLPDSQGKRPNLGNHPFQNDPHWKDLLLFNEYFHGDTGCGLGANHQTGWTALVAKLIQQKKG